MTTTIESLDRVLITGGGGFVGSHVAEFYATRGIDVIVFDNLSRAQLLGKGYENATYNWNYLKKYRDIEFIDGDITKADQLKKACKDTNAVIHVAAQTAVTASITDPLTDFNINAQGTLNILETARRSNCDPAVIYASTNKVYGSNVNKIEVLETETRYRFEDKFSNGIPEDFPIDRCEHTPYGCSKLAGDLYAQDYAKTYGLRTAIFRMSCIYGTRQFGVEDQGWVAWFTIATLTGKPITIYGDGKQVRDVLYVDDLISVFNAFLERKDSPSGEVFNAGGGPENTLSLSELLSTLEQITGRRSRVSFSAWRPSDQKVYISDISKAKEKLQWKPKINPAEGIQRLTAWVSENNNLFK